MNLEWITSPFALTALVAAGLIASIYLFLTLKMEIGENEARHREKYQALESNANELRAALAHLQLAVERAEEQGTATARPTPGMNMAKRGQVLRMYRRGEQPEQIAAALSLPLNEVDLLVKVHRAVINQF